MVKRENDIHLHNNNDDDDDDSDCLLSTYHLPALRYVLHITQSHLMHKTQRGRSSCLHVSDKQAEAQSSEITRLRIPHQAHDGGKI